MAKQSGRKRERARPVSRAALSSRLSILLRGFLISAVAIWIYWPALHGGWLWDDDVLVLQNDIVHASDGLWKIWFQPQSLIDFFPLKVTVEWIEWHLWADNTLGYHLVSVGLHILGALLVWRLLSKFGLRWAWLGGLIFAVHPVLVESVAWMAELKNTLSLPPFLLAMIFWIDFDEGRRVRDYVLSLIFFVVAMLCKTTMVTFPVVILLYAWWKRGNVGWKDLRSSLPFFAVSLFLGLTTYFVLNSHVIAQGSVHLGGPMTRFARVGLAIAFYFSKCLLPIRLVPIYPQWNLDSPTLAQFLPWPILAGVLYFLWTRRRSWGRHALLGIGFFLILLLPFSGFIAGAYMRFTWVMDHLLYIPIIGLIGLAVAGLESLAFQISASLRPVVYGLVALIALLFAWGSRSYAAVFLNAQAYWAYTARENPAAWPAYNNLAIELEKSGRFSDAMLDFNRSIELEPDYFEALANRGQLWLILNDLPKATADLDQAISLEPKGPAPYLTRGVLDLSQGGTAAALSDFLRYRQLAPHGSQADYALLWIWIIQAQQGQRSAADGDLATALGKNRNSPSGAWVTQDARFLLGQLGENDYLSAARSTDQHTDIGQHCEAWYYIGIKRLLAGDKAGAVTAFQNCLATGKTDFFEYILAHGQLAQSESL